MSQAGTYEAGNPGLLDVQTLTGNDGLVVVPDGAGNIDVLGDGTFIETTRTGANTLTITLLNTDVFNVTTVDATANVTLAPIPIPINAAISIYCEVFGVQNTFGQVCSGTAQGAAYNIGAGAVLAGVPELGRSATNFATAEFDIIVSGNNIELVVTGEAATTIDWTAVVRFINT